MRESTLLIGQASHRTCQAFCDARWTVLRLRWTWGHVAVDKRSST